MSDDENAVVEFLLSEPRFIQQVGDRAPRYVEASFAKPVIVRLPAKVMRKVRDASGRLVERWVDQPEGTALKLASKLRIPGTVKQAQPAKEQANAGR